MAFQIGRAGKTLALPDPEGWSSASYGSAIRGQGGDVVVTGTITGLTPAQALVLRDQLEGYQDNGDEPIVPVIVDAESRRTGYYRVMGVETMTDPTAVGYGILKYTVGLQPVLGFSQPMIEAILAGALLTNGVGAVDADTIYVHGVPATVIEYNRGTGLTKSTRSSSDGNLSIYRLAASLGGALGQYALAPANFYVGACTFEQGSALQPVVGRWTVQPDTVNWRVSNGLVRVTPNATPGKIDISHWKGAAWATAKTYTVTGTAAGLFNGFTSLTVTRNSVEEVSIRLGMAYSGTDIGRVFFDLTVHRGDNLVRGFIRCDSVDGFTFARGTAEAATAIAYGAVAAGGIRATANDADGNRYVMLSYAQAPTSDLVNGKLTLAGPTPGMDIAFGSAIGGGAAVAPDDVTSLAKQYIAAQIETQRVVAR